MIRIVHLQDRLRPLDFRLVVCTRVPDTFEHARAERMKVSGNPSHYYYLPILGTAGQRPKAARKNLLSSVPPV